MQVHRNNRSEAISLQPSTESRRTCGGGVKSYGLGGFVYYSGSGDQASAPPKRLGERLWNPGSRRTVSFKCQGTRKCYSIFRLWSLINSWAQQPAYRVKSLLFQQSLNPVEQHIRLPNHRTTAMKMTVCNSCGIPVVPMSNGDCPSCRKPLGDSPEINRTTETSARRYTRLKPRETEKLPIGWIVFHTAILLMLTNFAYWGFAWFCSDYNISHTHMQRVADATRAIGTPMFCRLAFLGSVLLPTYVLGLVLFTRPSLRSALAGRKNVNAG